jgi:ABC-type multidrug transport system fused ATPase/permease subunit
MTTDLKKIWSIFTPTERSKSAWMLVLIVLMAIAETGGVLSIMPFLSVLGRPAVIHQNHWLQLAYDRLGSQSTSEFLIALGLASIATVLGSSVFKTITLHLVNRFIHMLRHSISARLLSRYLHQPYEFFLTRNPSVLSRNVLSEVDQLLFNLIQPLSQLIAQGAVVLAILLLVFLYNPLTALAIVVVVGLLYGTIYSLVRKRLAHIGEERQTANARRFQCCNEVLGGIKDVKVTQATAAYQENFNRASRLLSRHMATSDTLSQSPLYLVEAVGYSGLIILALVLMLHRGDIAHVLPALGLYGFAAYRILPSAQIIYRGIAKLKFSSAALDAIHRDLLLPDNDEVNVSTALMPSKEIRLQNVSYAYPSTPRKSVLDHFDLAIPVGISVGIVGRTGAGKSTLMDILLGLLQPQGGSLNVDGIPIDASNVAAWQRAIGYVPQHIYLADASVAENIAFGVPRKDIDMAAVKRAARAAQIHDFVVGELEGSYSTPIGDRGIRLSGGQRQRIGIARALYRDPPVLLMDEATSALDMQTEAALNDAIGRLSGEKTIVIIAHKEASLQNCQIITHLKISNHQVDTT